MLRGLYSAASALVAQMTRQEMVSGNLANVDTPGFKRDSLTYKLAGQTSLPPDFASELATSKLLQTTGSNLPSYVSSALGAAAGTSAPGSIGLGVFTDSPITRFDQGVLKQTDRPLDLAIVGDGFFSIRDETGKTLYTRAGDFTLDAQSILRTADGREVLGESGNPISTLGAEVTIGPEGTVFVDGNPVDRLGIVCFGDDSQLRKVGKNAFELTGAESIPLENVTIRQGRLEGSNANATDLMIEMLAARRSYETAQKIFQMQDQTLGRAVNDVGRLG